MCYYTQNWIGNIITRLPLANKCPPTSINPQIHDFKPGGMLVVTGAAGAFGSMAAQPGKMRGLLIVGIAGGPAKAAFLKKTLGMDDPIDYRAEDFAAWVRRALPNGLNAFFESVGRLIFPVLDHFNRNAKMVICGTISDYSDTQLPTGTNYLP